MTKEITYAITVYEYHSLDKEEYSLYRLNFARLQQTIMECIRNNKSFRVAVFDGE